jgi:hypothetical protein
LSKKGVLSSLFWEFLRLTLFQNVVYFHFLKCSYTHPQTKAYRKISFHCCFQIGPPFLSVSTLIIPTTKASSLSSTSSYTVANALEVMRLWIFCFGISRATLSLMGSPWNFGSAIPIFTEDIQRSSLSMLLTTSSQTPLPIASFFCNF